MSSPPIALVPLRSPGVGKSRLAPSLAPAQRARLATAMIADVVAALRGGGIERIVVAADGPRAGSIVRRLGVEVILDPPGVEHLDTVLAHAAQRLGPTGSLLVVAGDLPTLRGPEVAELITTDAEVVVAPTTGGGTGALLRRPGDRIATAYGPDSARRHLELAALAGALAGRRALDGFAHDVDTWTDLVGLHELELGPATAAVLPGLLGVRAAS